MASEPAIPATIAYEDPVSLTTIRNQAASKSIVSRIQAYDTNGDNKLDPAEVITMVEDMRRTEGERRELKEQRSRLRMLLLGAGCVIILLAISTFGVSWAASELTKEIHVNEAVLNALDGSVVKVGDARAAVPLYTLAAMNMEALGRVKSLFVSYVDSDERVRRNLAIVSQVKRGSIVELLDVLGFKVVLQGTSNARFVTPDGNNYAICAGVVECASVMVDNYDLHEFEQEAVDLQIEEEDRQGSISLAPNETQDDISAQSRRRRLNIHERRRLARRRLDSSCVTAKSYPQVLFLDWTTNRECHPTWDSGTATNTKPDISKEKCLAQCQGWNSGAGGCCWYRSNKDKCRWYDARDGNIQYQWRNDGDSKTIFVEGDSIVIGQFAWGTPVALVGDDYKFYYSYVLTEVAQGQVVSSHTKDSMDECQEKCLSNNNLMAEFYPARNRCKCYTSYDDVVLSVVWLDNKNQYRTFSFYSDLPSRTTWTSNSKSECSSRNKFPANGAYYFQPQRLAECKELCLHKGRTVVEFWTYQSERICRCCDNFLNTTSRRYTWTAQTTAVV